LNSAKNEKEIDKEFFGDAKRDEGADSFTNFLV
jgi:hypothetical protein